MYGVTTSLMYNRTKERNNGTNRMAAQSCCDKKLKCLIQEYIKGNKLQTRFSEDRPGDDWCGAVQPIYFFKRTGTFSKDEKKGKWLICYLQLFWYSEDIINSV